MKIYVFEYVGECSGNYHSGGGAVIIAESVEAGKELIVEDTKPKYWVMPDAGCC